jgi:cyclin D1/2/4
VFEPSTIHRMEILVLNTLSWRMQAVTPCSFIDYYLHKFSDGDVVSEIILSRAVELILSTSKGMILTSKYNYVYPFCTKLVECDD